MIEARVQFVGFVDKRGEERRFFRAVPDPGDALVLFDGDEERQVYVRHVLRVMASPSLIVIVGPSPQS